MNKLINELEKKLKIATGRLISENNMKKAPLVSPDQLQDPDYWLMGFEDSNQRDYTILAKGFNPQGYVKISREFGPSGYGYYNVWKSDIRKFYNPEGKLEKKEAGINSDWGCGKFIPGIRKTTVYDPAGSFFGKVEK